MAKKKKHILSIRVTDREQIWGFVYLLVSLFVLPSLLKWGNGLLPFPISNTWLNFFYFLLNFLFILWIFQCFINSLYNCFIHSSVCETENNHKNN